MTNIQDKIACLEARLKKEENDADIIRGLLSQVGESVDLMFNRRTSYRKSYIPTLYGNVWDCSTLLSTKVILQYVPNSRSIALRIGRSKTTYRSYVNGQGYSTERVGVGGYSKRILLKDMACLFGSLRKHHVRPSEVIARLKSYGGKIK
ncbi:hypothetical protein HYT26_01155 [Candidatus Pacearchaeota archaeon]|nr:hypothetical protein [Candidatus Pacearchaeota archaeon]